MTIVNLRYVPASERGMLRIDTAADNGNMILAYGQMSFSMQLHLGNEERTARTLASLIGMNLRTDLIDLDQEERVLAKIIAQKRAAAMPEESETLERQIRSMESMITQSEWLTHLLGRASDRDFDLHSPVQDEYFDVAAPMILEGQPHTYAEWIFGAFNHFTEKLTWFGIHDAVIMSKMLRDPIR